MGGFGTPSATSGTTPSAGTSQQVPRADHQHGYDSAVVHLSGTETITGAKTFTSPVTIGSSGAVLTGSSGELALSSGRLYLPSDYIYLLTGNVLAGAQDGTSGRIVLNAGYTNSSGYVGFFNKNAGREGYIGNASTTAGSDGGTLQYKAGLHEFTGDISLNGRNIEDWTTYTPTLTNISSGTVSAKWKYLNYHLIYLMISITAGTITTGGTNVTATIPAGLTVDTFMDQPLSGRFNTASALLAYAVASGTTISISGSDADGTALANGTSFSNVRIAGTIAVQ